MRDTRGAKYVHRERHAKPAKEVTLRVWTDREKTLAAVALVLRDLGVSVKNAETIIRLANLKIDSISDATGAGRAVGWCFGQRADSA